MANNPFESPAPIVDTAGPMRSNLSMPTGLMIICILCIVLGAAGVLSSIIQGAAIAFQSQLQAFNESIGDESQQAMQEEIAKIQDGYFIPSIMLLIGNIFVAPMLLIGSIGVLIRKTWSAGLLKMGLLAAAIYCFANMLCTAYMQFQLISPMKNAMLEQLEDDPNAAEAAGIAEGVFSGMMYLGIGMMVVWALMLIGFYLFSRFYLGKAHVESYLATFK